MVNFETEVYNRQSDDVIGVKVIVVADNGQTIESIRCVNETDFQELKEKLDVLDESYVVFASGSSLAGLNIDTILANANEAATINATSLGGYQSDYYAKSNHQHQKSNITDLYNYDISLNKYNVNLNNPEDVTVTVKVTDSANSPVNKHTISIYKNGVLWKSNVKTNSSGVYTATFTPTDGGIVTFAVNNQKVQCFVDASQVWKEVTMITSSGSTPGQMKLIINESLHLAKLLITNTSANFKSDLSLYYNAAIPQQYRPVNQVLSGTVFNRGRILISSAGSIYFTTIDDNNYTGKNASCTLLWNY